MKTMWFDKYNCCTPEMGKKNSWFTSLKRFFLPERKLKSQEKQKKEVWVFDTFKNRKHGGLQRTMINQALPGPEVESLDEERPVDQMRHEEVVATASKAAAEAAVASAKAADEVVRLTTITYEFARQNFSALKIQCAFRRHLAKKALSALKGVVKLQGMIRGRLLRKYLTGKLASIPRHSPLLDYLNDIETRRHPDERIKPKERKCNIIRSGWDQSFVQEEGSDIRKQEAAVKRERMKQYSYSHREMRNEENKKSKRFDQNLQVKEEVVVHHHNQHLKEVRTSVHVWRKLKESESNYSPRPSSSSSSFSHAKHKSIGEDDDESSLPNSPIFPAYMAPTESAIARVRSLSTPRHHRLGLLYDTSSSYPAHEDSPYKHRLSTFNRE